MDTGIGSAAAGNMDTVTDDHGSGFFHGFSNSRQVLLNLPTVIVCTKIC